MALSTLTVLFTSRLSSSEKELLKQKFQIQYAWDSMVKHQKDVALQYLTK